MCVIIYIPQKETISKEELKQAWETNPHGAGYAVQVEEGVKFSRGFMNFKSFYENIRHYIGGYNLLLHFRITTSNVITRVQTHPYQITDIKKLSGITSDPVVCMNGSIFQQSLYKNFNDTMSYIKDYKKAFKVVNKAVLELIAENTGSKWAVMLPDKVYLSDQFTEHKGKYYSNKNHLHQHKVYCCDVYDYDTIGKKPTLKELLEPKLYKKVLKDKQLKTILEDFITTWKDYPYVIQELEFCYNVEHLQEVLGVYY